MFDTEKFICEVEARPPLYNVQSNEYSNREVKATCCAEVGGAMYEDWSTVSSSIKKRERFVNFLYVGFSLFNTKIVELMELLVLKTWIVTVFCDFLNNSSNDFVSFL
jgi:hypothetical protein